MPNEDAAGDRGDCGCCASDGEDGYGYRWGYGEGARLLCEVEVGVVRAVCGMVSVVDVAGVKGARGVRGIALVSLRRWVDGSSL